MKTCTKCGKEFPRSERRYRCRDCVREYSKNRYERVREDRLAWERWAHLRRTYGLTQERYEELLAHQAGGCGVCRTTEPGGRGNNFHVDHDHACCPGKKSCGLCIRGLLCAKCNNGLGAYNDDPALLAAAIRYLDAQSAQ